jgi:hypothetical protein
MVPMASSSNENLPLKAFYWAKHMEIAWGGGGKIWTMWWVLHQLKFQLIYCFSCLIGHMRIGIVKQQDDILSKFATVFGSDGRLQFHL